MDSQNEAKENAVILIVDDDAMNRNLLKERLARSGYQSLDAETGEAALAICETEPVDLVLLDINMPGMNGFDVCRSLKAGERHTDTPVIFISGLSNTDEKVKAFGCGGVDYLTKPFEAAELRSRIKTHLEIRKNRQTISRYADHLQQTIDDMATLFETGTLVANVVHDAKKFTTAMSMMIESMILPRLNEKLDGSQEWVQDLIVDISEVLTNSNQCTDYLESLLSINRKSGEIEPVDLQKIINQAVTLISYNMIQDGIRWEVRSDIKNGQMVMGSPQLIRVFINLIVNAMDALKKHETPDPKIILRLVEQTDTVQASVIDNGSGIPGDVLESIRKGLVISTKGKAGNGFGVSGLTRIVNRFNGTVDIESEPGQGAVFTVTLKKSNQDEPGGLLSG